MIEPRRIIATYAKNFKIWQNILRWCLIANEIGALGFETLSEDQCWNNIKTRAHFRTKSLCIFNHLVVLPTECHSTEIKKRETKNNKKTELVLFIHSLIKKLLFVFLFFLPKFPRAKYLSQQCWCEQSIIFTLNDFFFFFGWIQYFPFPQ